MNQGDVSAVLVSEDVEFQVVVPFVGVGNVQIPSILIGLGSLQMDDETLSHAKISDSFGIIEFVRHPFVERGEI